MTRQTTLRSPTADAETIRKLARDLFATHWDRDQPLRLLGVGVHNLVEKQDSWQLELL